MPINYDLKRIGLYVALSLSLYALSIFVDSFVHIYTLELLYKTILFLVFISITINLDLKPMIPSVFAKFLKK